MIKTRWVRNVAVFGTAAVMSLACVGTIASEGTAATFCQETQMAGLSLSLDKFYTENYVNVSEPEVVQEDTVSATATPEATAPPAADTTAETAKEEGFEKLSRLFSMVPGSRRSMRRDIANFLRTSRLVSYSPETETPFGNVRTAVIFM